ncbi:MAG: hypothetical protein EBT33_20440, partial [Betaproteobacteria bacterium]|nr:hypothetical protein [Betaproteobacteria bacterium]
MSAASWVITPPLSAGRVQEIASSLDLRDLPADFYANPFASIDVSGVGQLMKVAVEKGRKTRKDIKLGICGEHGGDPHSVVFCHHVGLDYVSCSPFRL